MSKDKDAEERSSREEKSSEELITVILTIKGIKLEKGEVLRILNKYYPAEFIKLNKEAFTSDYYWSAPLENDYELVVCAEDAILALNTFSYDLSTVKQEMVIVDELSPGEIDKFHNFAKGLGLDPRTYAEYQTYAQRKQTEESSEPYDYEGSDD